MSLDGREISFPLLHLNQGGRCSGPSQNFSPGTLRTHMVPQTQEPYHREAVPYLPRDVRKTSRNRERGLGK